MTCLVPEILRVSVNISGAKTILPFMILFIDCMRFLLWFFLLTVEDKIPSSVYCHFPFSSSFVAHMKIL